MAVFWASSYPLGRHLAQFQVPAVVAGLRLAFATACLLLIAGAAGQLKQQFTPRVLGIFLLMGASGICVHNLLMMYALQFTRANTGAVINGAIPLMIVLLDFLLFRRNQFVYVCNVFISEFLNIVFCTFLLIFRGQLVFDQFFNGFVRISA